MKRYTRIFLIGLIAAASALPGAVAETKVEADIARHARDPKGWYEVTFQMTPKLFSEFILPLIKDHQVKSLGDANLDISQWLEPMGISSTRGTSAIANRKTGILTFVNAGDQIPLICDLLDPVVYPRSFRACRPLPGYQ